MTIVFWIVVGLYFVGSIITTIWMWEDVPKTWEHWWVPIFIVWMIALLWPIFVVVAAIDIIRENRRNKDKD